MWKLVKRFESNLFFMHTLQLSYIVTLLFDFLI